MIDKTYFSAYAVLEENQGGLKKVSKKKISSETV